MTNAGIMDNIYLVIAFFLSLRQKLETRRRWKDNIKISKGTEA
jgi:hypothetical protein